MPEATRQRPFTGWHMLTIVVLFFGTIFSVNFYMAYLAFDSWTGLVVKNSYVASQEFNERLSASRAQAALEWQTDLTYRGGTLYFYLNEKNGTPLLTDKVIIDLSRAIGTSEDRVLELVPEGLGYAVSHDIPRGAWNVIIRATIPGFPGYEYRARLQVAD